MALERLTMEKSIILLRKIGFVNAYLRIEKLSPDDQQQISTQNLFHTNDTIQRTNDSPKFADVPDLNPKTKTPSTIKNNSHKHEQHGPPKITNLKAERLLGKLFRAQ